MLILSIIFSGILISAVLITIINLNIEKFLSSKNIDLTTHNTGLLINTEIDGKDKNDYDKCIGKIYFIFVVIFSILSYIILPKL